MARAPRLLNLLDILRRHRRPVTAAKLAEELGVTVRTIYRDIVTLIGEGADIVGEAGVGYVLRPGFTLPPLMFTEQEIEALVFGLRLAAEHGDAELAEAADAVLGKITAVLPEALQHSADEVGLLAGPVPDPDLNIDVALIRDALRGERKLRLVYSDRDGVATRRVVWPIAVGYFTENRVLAAWCEKRNDFRHFRLDRMIDAEILNEPLPKRRAVLLREWQRKEGIAF